MSRNNNDESAVYFGMILLAGVCIYVYFQIKALAAWAHLDMSAAGYMVLGGVAVVAVIVVAILAGWPLSKVLPWMPLLFVWFLIPALNYWSVDREGDYILGSPSWYGLLWGRAVIVLACGVFGWSVYQAANDD